MKPFPVGSSLIQSNLISSNSMPFHSSPLYHRFLRLCLFTFGLVGLIVGTTAADDRIDFNRDIRPLLSDNCIFCHGPDSENREADLRLDIESDAKKDLGDDWVIKEGQPKNSMLVDRIFSDDPDHMMPPPESGKQLDDRQKKLLQNWITQGAKWSRHWAYEVPVKHSVPKSESKWPINWIDRLIIDRLEKESMSPAPDASGITLIRRLYFDLTGLPPTTDQVSAFLNDKSERAVSRVIQELLQSPHFGERMAIYWLDLVRFADTVGYHGDQDHSIAPFRDWVIRAFNDNMPFDQFTREQLAGDLLKDPDESQLIATGYNRLLQTTHEGGLQPSEYRAMYAADRVRNLSAVWLGGTLGCAQCHDHKYDPYTSRDFYSMAAFFADINDEQHFKDGSNSLPTRRSPEIRVILPDIQEQINKLQKLKDQLIEQFKNEKSEESKAEIVGKRKQVEADINKLTSSGYLTMITQALDKPRVTRILPRGNFLDQTGPVVEPAVPEFLQGLGKINPKKRLTRLDLANWLTDEDHSSSLLTARVFVNRIWYLLFGAGLTPNLDDFGGQGSPPVHPELLDNLAISFVASGWDVKRLITLIASSRTYQISSVATESHYLKDPENRLFARQSHQRLPAEFIRDNALAVSGLLVTDIGGLSVKPYQPDGYYRNLNFPTRKYSPHLDQRQYKRGVYMHWQRQFLHPMLKAFDAPRREECTAQRSRSNTPIAALVLLNDPTFVESTRVLAEKIRTLEPDINQAVAKAFLMSLSRPPDQIEAKALVALYKSNLGKYNAEPAAAAQLLSVGLSPSPRFNQPEIAALTQVIRVIFNLDEFVSRR